MLSRDHTLALALLLSLALHAGLLFVVAGRARAQQVPAIATQQRLTAAITIDRPASPPPAELRFGDLNGRGDAAGAEPGIDPMRAMRAEEAQPLLSRDPRGPGKIGDEPSMSALPRGGAAGAEASVPEPPAAPVGIADTSGQWQSPRMKTKPDKPAAQVRTTAAPPSLSPGAPAPPADPAIQSESESDPFSASSSTIDFNDGRVDARFGRKVRTVRPRLSLAAKIDLSLLPAPRMRVRLRIDSSGNVRKVDIVQSSGSDNADQAVRLALYQWWIEPKKDKSGKPVDDVVEFTIDWR